MKTEEDQQTGEPDLFTEQELNDFLDQLFTSYISSSQYDMWTGRTREKHYLMLRRLQQGITKESHVKS